MYTIYFEVIFMLQFFAPIINKLVFWVYVKPKMKKEPELFLKLLIAIRDNKLVIDSSDESFEELRKNNSVFLIHMVAWGMDKGFIEPIPKNNNKDFTLTLTPKGKLMIKGLGVQDI